MSDAALAEALHVRDLPYPLVRLGDVDGYVVCDLPPLADSGCPYDGFVSGGVGPDVNFEDAVLGRYPALTCDVYDGTVAAFPRCRHGRRLRFHPANVAPADADAESSLAEHFAGKHDLLVKLDIEGAEFAWFDALPDERLGAIRQLVAELHWLDTGAGFRLLERLARTHWLAHAHGCNDVEYTVVRGVRAPRVLEVTLVRKDGVAAPWTTRPLPGPLDRATHRDRRDLALGPPFVAPAPGALGVGDAGVTFVTHLFDIGRPPAAMAALEAAAAAVFALPVPLVVFADAAHADAVRRARAALPFPTDVRVRDLAAYPPFAALGATRRALADTPFTNGAPTKDTAEYLALISAKVWMWGEAARANPFGAARLVCLDAGLAHIAPDVADAAAWGAGAIPERVRFMVIRPYLGEPAPFFRTIHHNIAGGLVTGAPAAVAALAAAYAAEHAAAVAAGEALHEESLFARLLYARPNAYDTYFGDFASIVANYRGARDVGNLAGVARLYLDARRYVDAQAVLDSVDVDWLATAAGPAARQMLEFFVEYSILTNYYSMFRRLDPRAARLIAARRADLAAVLDRQRANLAFYEAITFENTRRDPAAASAAAAAALDARDYAAAQAAADSIDPDQSAAAARAFADLSVRTNFYTRGALDPRADAILCRPENADLRAAHAANLAYYPGAAAARQCASAPAAP